MIRFCENKIIKLGNSCLMFFCFAASGGWQEPENPHTQRMNKLIEYYQQLAQKEKVERDRKKLARRRNYMPLAFSVRTWYKKELCTSFIAACMDGIRPLTVSESGHCT